MREQDMHVHLSPSHSASPFFFVPKNFSGACVNKRGSSKGLSNPVIPSQVFAQSCDLNGYFRHSAPYACFQSSRISPPSCFKILACITGTLSAKGDQCSISRKMQRSAHLAHTVPVTQGKYWIRAFIRQIPDPEKHIGDFHQKLEGVYCMSVILAKAPYKPKVFAA